MKLSVNTEALNFRKEDIDGNLVDLEQYRGKKILLSFYRNVVCPFCNFRIYKLMKKAKAWEDKIQMVFLFESKNKTIIQSSFHKDLSPIPLIGDPEKEIYKRYGVERSYLKTFSSALQASLRTKLKEFKELNIEIEPKEAPSNIIPADFLINEDFTIVEAFYGKNISDHIPFEQIEEFIYEH